MRLDEAGREDGVTQVDHGCVGELRLALLKRPDFDDAIVINRYGSRAGLVGVHRDDGTGGEDLLRHGLRLGMFATLLNLGRASGATIRMKRRPGATGDSRQHPTFVKVLGNLSDDESSGTGVSRCPVATVHWLDDNVATRVVRADHLAFADVDRHVLRPV